MGRLKLRFITVILFSLTSFSLFAQYEIWTVAMEGIDKVYHAAAIV